MRGSLKQRAKGTWSIILDLGDITDAATGTQKRQQRWTTFRGTRKQAEEKLSELLSAVHGDLFVEPSKVTVIGWLRTWLDLAIDKDAQPATHTRYRGIIENAISQATIAELPVQRLRASHLEAYYKTVKGSASTRVLHHTVIRRALQKATRDRLVAHNVAADLEGRPKRDRSRSSEDARTHCWSGAEARQFLDAAKKAGAQAAAFFALALDSGARKGELCGLAWTELDLEAGKVHIMRQLRKPGAAPTFGPPKGKRPRTITLSAETVALLRTHRQAQRELKMKNRTSYHDFELVFAKEWGELHTREDHLGQPLQANNLGARWFDPISKAADVKRIKFHGTRHTSATLLLLAHVPVHVVAQRLGHRDVTTTMNVYAHALPDAQRSAADSLAAVLYGR